MTDSSWRDLPAVAWPDVHPVCGEDFDHDFTPISEGVLCQTPGCEYFIAREDWEGDLPEDDWWEEAS